MAAVLQTAATDKRRTLLLGFAAVMCRTFRRRLLIGLLNLRNYSTRVRTLGVAPFGARLPDQARRLFYCDAPLYLTASTGRKRLSLGNGVLPSTRQTRLNGRGSPPSSVRSNPMALQDDQLNRFAGVSKSVTEMEEATLDELEEADAAEEAWKTADEALADYKAAKLWGSLTNGT